jgi:hypothetical protein
VDIASPSAVFVLALVFVDFVVVDFVVAVDEEAGELAFVDATASGETVLWAWNPSTAAVPATVAERTMGARFM